MFLEWQSEHLKPRVTSVHDEIPLRKLPYSTCIRPIWGDVHTGRFPPDSHQNLQCHFISCTCYVKVILTKLMSHHYEIWVHKVTKHTCSFSECPCIGFPSVDQDTSMLLSSHFLNDHYLVPASFLEVVCHWSVVTFSPQHRGTWLVATSRGTESDNGDFFCFEDSLKIP